MTVLHISTTDNAGGSGRSAYRVHTGLRRLGHRSRMLVSLRVTEDPDVRPIWGTLPWRAADWIARGVTERLSLQYLLLPSSWKLLRHPWYLEADIVQLYNIHGGYFSYPVLAPISQRKPVVWRLSDMWPMTGHCAYSFDCDRWRTGCGTCPLLFDAPALRTDRTALLWRVKRWVYERSRITLVAPSRWIAELAAQSPLLGRFPIHRIPNGVDTTTFQPITKRSAREILGLSPEDLVVLFSSIEINAPRKGGALLKEALELLRRQNGPRFRLLVVGNGAKRWESGVDFPVKTIEAVKDDPMLAVIYSSADVFVHPALAENLPNSILESMACGTPVVSFNIGGVPDAVRPMETGYLACYQDAADLAKGIGLILGSGELRQRLSRRCREVMETEFSLDLQSRRFEHLYKQLLENQPIEFSHDMSQQPVM